MDVIRRYFEDHPDLFAALVGALAIVGGLLGSVIGAKIQANGGRDQARAAREAAEISAEAQRVSALWTVRQVQTAEFVQRVRELARMADQFYRQESSDALLRQALEVYQATGLKHAEIALIAPMSVVEAADRVFESVGELGDRSAHDGPCQHAITTLSKLTFDVDPAISRPAMEAYEILMERLLTSGGAGEEPITLPPLSDLRQGLEAVPGLGAPIINTLTQDVHSTPSVIDKRKRQAEEALEHELVLFVMAARTMLKSDDDRATSVAARVARGTR